MNEYFGQPNTKLESIHSYMEACAVFRADREGQAGLAHSQPELVSLSQCCMFGVNFCLTLLSMTSQACSFHLWEVQSWEH